MIEKLLSNSSYSFNIYALPMFLTATSIILLGVYVLLQEKSVVTKAFFFSTLSAGIWQLGTGLIYLMKDHALVVWFYKVFVFLGIVAIAPSIYMLTVSVLGLFESKKKYIALSYVIALFFYLSDLLTDSLTTGVKERFWGPYITYGILSAPFLIFFSFLMGRSIYLSSKIYRGMKSGISRDQIKLHLISLIIALSAAVDFFSCYLPMDVYPFGYLAILSVVFLQAYAIITYQKASLSEIFNSIEDGIVVTDNEGRITKINLSVERLTGIGAQTLSERRLKDLIYTYRNKFEDPKQVEEFLQKIRENPNRIVEGDIGLRNPAIQLDIKYSRISDRFGIKTGSVIVLRDITQRKKVEQELREYKEELETRVEQRTQELKQSEEKYRALVSHAQVGIGIHKKGRMIFTNAQFRTMLGYTEEEMTNMEIAQLIHPDEVKLVLKRAWDRYNGKDVIDTYDIQFLKKDGSVLPAIISNVVIDYQGERATLLTVVDTTETKMRRELEIANQELEMFAYSVSHDLRAPLRTIDGFSQALLEDYQDKLDEEGKDYLMRIRAASQRMGLLINSILQLSRLGRSEMRLEEVDLSGLAQNIATELETNDPDRKVDFVIEKDVKGIGDKTLLRAVMENLLGNAWKFTQKQAEAKIEFGKTEKEGKTIYFIRDNGVGFDMKYANKLFIPFQRLHSDSEFAGTGVGLTLVQRIVRRHGGDIWVESAVEKGATFYFTLER